MRELNPNVDRSAKIYGAKGTKGNMNWGPAKVYGAKGTKGNMNWGTAKVYGAKGTKGA